MGFCLTCLQFDAAGACHEPARDVHRPVLGLSGQHRKWKRKEAAMPNDDCVAVS